MKRILLIPLCLLFLFSYGQPKATNPERYAATQSQSGNDAYANSNSVKKQWDNCQQKLSDITAKMNARNAEYEKEKKEFLNGEFCSDCIRSKSRVEKEDHISFQQHIQNGAAGGRRVVRATQKQLDDLHQKYLSEFKNLQDNYKSQQGNCNDLGSQYNEAKNQDQQNAVKSQQDEARRIQDENNRKTQERIQQAQDKYNELMEEQRQQRLKEQLAQDEMTNKMNANQQETDQKKDAYNQESKLDGGYVDRSSDAKLLLDPSNMANESEVFGSVFNDNYNEGNQDKKSFVSNLRSTLGEYRNSIKEKMVTFKEFLFSGSLIPGSGDELPPDGYGDSFRDKFNRNMQPIRDKIDEWNTKYGQYVNTYNKYKEYYESTEKKTIPAFFKEHLDATMKVANEMESNPDAYGDYYRSFSANVIGYVKSGGIRYTATHMNTTFKDFLTLGNADMNLDFIKIDNQ